jgi:ribosome biogenesis GTPase
VALRMATGGGTASFEEVLPRATALIRKASGENRPQLLAANVDVVFIVTAPDGDFNLPRIERLLALVADSAAVPVIIISKSDLADNVAAVIGEIACVAPGVPVHAVSAHAHRIGDVEHHFEGNRTVALIGSSGVGKSTLTNTLLGRAAQATQEVRAHDSRGRHTTTHRQLFLRAHGGCIIDTPGMRGVEVWNTSNVIDSFEDIEALALDCKFSNCRHVSEPKCGVRAAMARGDVETERVAHYIERARSTQAGRR